MFIRRALLISAFAFAALAANNLPGTWKLNVAKSKYTGIPTPKETMVTYTTQGQGWKYEAKGISGDGQPTNMSFAYEKDGADCPITGFPYADAISIKNGNGDVTTSTFKRGGKAVGTVKRTVSKDGKTIMLDGKLTLADGKKATYMAVYEKQ